MSHTPGPWFVHTKRTLHSPDGEADRFESALYSGDGIPPTSRVAILEWGYGRKENDADARLIAAAPELLEALADIVEEFEALYPDSQSDRIDRARAAIKKARGE